MIYKMLWIRRILWDWAISCSMIHAQKGALHVKTIKDVLLAARSVAVARNGPLAARSGALAGNSQHGARKDDQAATGNQHAAKKGTLAGNGVHATSVGATAAAAFISRRNGNGASSSMPSHVIVHEIG
ncbi:hypothetical protein ABE28_006380 [Peribacillus muralis]|uniref:Uncharacterized protein n=2 Tax=Peribacillus muralis TaxID=264697 RepID=A0A1B3XL68_9BACI|nr:hypothetical protein ABE28_006380 [Peribacillus muralis]